MELNLEGAEENQEQAGVDLFVAPFCHLHLVLLVCVRLSNLSEIQGNFRYLLSTYFLMELFSIFFHSPGIISGQ